MLKDIFFAIWFLLPAACANVAPILAAAMPGLKRLNAPLDNGKTYRGHRIFGPHKTWRGIISGMLMATFILWLQKYVVTPTDSLPTYVNYDDLTLLILGPLFGLGALGGDAVESFFKRQKGIESGKKWMPFDQLDYTLGAILVTLPFVLLPIQIYVYMLIFWFFGHLLASYIGYLLRLKEAPL